MDSPAQRSGPPSRMTSNSTEDSVFPQFSSAPKVAYDNDLHFEGHL
jgi:hypothetical protein